MDTLSEDEIKHPFPFNEDDVVAAYRKHTEVCPVVGHWITEVWVEDEATHERTTKCGVCALSVMALDRGDKIEDFKRMDEEEDHEAFACRMAELFDVSEDDVNAFVSGFDKQNYEGGWLGPSKEFGIAVREKLVAEGLLSK